MDASEITLPTDGETEPEGYTALPKEGTDIEVGSNTHYMIIGLKEGKVFFAGGGQIVVA